MVKRCDSAARPKAKTRPKATTKRPAAAPPQRSLVWSSLADARVAKRPAAVLLSSASSPTSSTSPAVHAHTSGVADPPAPADVVEGTEKVCCACMVKFSTNIGTKVQDGSGKWRCGICAEVVEWLRALASRSSEVKNLCSLLAAIGFSSSSAYWCLN